MLHLSKSVPQHLLAELLCRLPAKSLVRFRSVCSQWSTLICSADFSAKRVPHFASHHPPPPLLVLLHENDNSFPRIAWFREETVLEALHVPFPPSADAEIVGSCHGLLCFSLSADDLDFVVWNPATRQVRFLPPPSDDCPDRDHFVRVGFGFNLSVNDFKVVRILCVNAGEGSSDYMVSKVEVFSRSRGLWRVFGDEDVNEIRKLELSWRNRGFPVVYNGKIYWFADEEDGENEENEPQLLSFDIENESFGKMTMPRPRASNHSKIINMVVYGGSLVAFHMLLFGSELFVDIWCMNDSGNMGQSWTMLKTIGSFPTWTRPVAIWTDHQFMLEMNYYKQPASLHLYDHNTGEDRRIQTGHFDFGSTLAHAYTETLIPVH